MKKQKSVDVPFAFNLKNAESFESFAVNDFHTLGNPLRTVVKINVTARTSAPQCFRTEA